MTIGARLIVTLAVSAAGTLGVAGCGIEDPYNRPQAADRERPAVTRADATASTPRGAVTSVAEAYGNWTTATVADAYDRARRLTVGRARRQLGQEGSAVATSVEDTRERLRSRATVEAVTMSGSGNRRGALVVTRQQITGGRLAEGGYEYKVTLATVERRGAGWVISQWSPQP